MRFNGFKQFIGLALAALVIFAVAESSLCIEDFDANDTANCCGCTHEVLPVPVVSVLPLLNPLHQVCVGFVSIPDWQSEPPLRPPTA